MLELFALLGLGLAGLTMVILLADIISVLLDEREDDND